MDPTRIPLLDLAEQRLAWADRRQEVLAQNIANIDTPGWQPRDLPPFAATLANASGAALARTQPGHITGMQNTEPQTAAAARSNARQPDGNAVTLDQQLSKVADTATTQELATTIYKKYLGLFSLALGRSQ